MTSLPHNRLEAGDGSGRSIIGSLTDRPPRCAKAYSILRPVDCLSWTEEPEGDNRLDRRTISIAGAELELFEAGSGRPLLFLHGLEGFAPERAFVGRLARARRLIAPSHPGFGRSSLPDWLDHVADIAHLYLALLDRLAVPRFDLVGCSLGGWIAAEIASMVPERLRRLVLVGPVGVKLGPVDRLDIPDLFALPQEQVDRLMYRDPARMRLDPAALSDEALRIVVRNRETLALLTWEPYMHDPKLRHRLHRVAAPTLFLRGAADGVVSAEYLASYARLVAGAHIDSIAEAGHLPHLEQPAAFADRVLAFLEAGT